MAADTLDVSTEVQMTAICSSTSSQATALAQARARLASDQAAKAAADILKADQKAVDQATQQAK
jgi:hypothetical protein